jgi:hypothetical protein
MTKNSQTIKENFKYDGEDPVKLIMEDHHLDPSIWYPETIKIKEGKWNTAAKKRKQELKWTIKEDKNGEKQQYMEGFSKHFPEFMMAENKTYAIWVTFKRYPIENEILDSFIEIMKEMPALPRQAIRKIIRNGVAGEMTTFDAHAAKLAWLNETGYRNYDLGIAMKDIQYTNDNNLDLMSPHKPEKLFYILGQDLYHVDNMAGNTTNGTHAMDVDGRITKVHKKVFEVSRNNILNCAKLANTVEVIWIPGNHDFLASYMLAFALKEHFRNCPNITVDVGENPRKARLWGTLLVGWTHRIVNKHTVWANELAQQFPELWAKSKFREWHYGDQHKKDQVKVNPIFTSGGVLCRQITALSPVDKWHTDNVFTDAVPGGESFLWSKEGGVFANFMTWTGQYEENRNQIVNKK